jgi:hypothetical protein
MRFKLFIIAACILCIQTTLLAQSEVVNKYAVNWDSPSANASGAMPIGNGEVGANVWMEPNGNLVFYLSRTDAWAENSNLYKLGRLRVSLYPFLKGNDVTFHQSLNLAEGKIEFVISNKRDQIKLDFLIDSDSPIVYVQGKSSYPVQIGVSSEIWRTQPRQLQLAETYQSVTRCQNDSMLMESADVVKDFNNHLMVYHRNEHSVYYPVTLKLQELSDASINGNDPYINRTMGYDVSGDGFVKITPTLLSTPSSVSSFCLKIAAYTKQTATAQEWIDQIEQLLENAPAYEVAAKRTATWWKNYWDKSYVMIETPDKTTGHRLTQAYILQSWMNACGGRGDYPIKFNGSIFTVDPGFTDIKQSYGPDYRRWGPDYWWQNTRLVYHPMLKSGDYDMLRVLFRHYFSILPMMKRNAKVFFGVDGAYSPETSTIFGTFDNNCYGWDRSKLKTGEIANSYIRNIWNPGLEMAALMGDYYHYTNNKPFARDTLVPMANEVLKFFDNRFPRDEKGLFTITPTHAIETYWTGVVNDMPCVAGLHYVLKQLLNLPEDCASAADRHYWKQLQKQLPAIPQHIVDGKTVFAPAEKYDAERSNVENPELYVIFPFSLCNISTSDKQIGIETFKQRVVRDSVGWTQDGQEAACLGLTEEARSNVLARINNSNPHHRFPAFWGPNFDWAPDQNHGGNLLTTVQDMILQSYDKGIYILPAFPKDWNVTFKLHSFDNNVVTGRYQDGKWLEQPKAKGKYKIIVCTK